jgi:hypothetical protein
MRGDTRSKLLVVTVLACGVLGGLCLAKPKDHSQPQLDKSAESLAAPRDLLNRIWFDKLPEKRSDEVTIALFFGGGIGVFDTGSAYRASFEMFEFERKATEPRLRAFARQKTGYGEVHGIRLRRQTAVRPLPRARGKPARPEEALRVRVRR